jgi:hypothetical protein
MLPVLREITVVKMASTKEKTYYTVVQNSQNFSGLFPSSCIPKNTTFPKLDLFPSSGEGGEKTPTQLGPVERAHLNHWIVQFPKRFFGI